MKAAEVSKVCADRIPLKKIFFSIQINFFELIK